MFKVRIDAILQDVFEKFAETGGKGDGAKVVYGGFLSRFGDEGDVGVFPGGGKGVVKPMLVEELYKVF